MKFETSRSWKLADTQRRNWRIGAVLDALGLGLGRRATDVEEPHLVAERDVLALTHGRARLRA